MAEYIGCRNCDSPDCHSCNVYTLYRMLNSGKFDGLMNGNRSINPAADVVEVRHGRWDDVQGGFWKMGKCSNCGTHWSTIGANYCPNCGARMRGAEDE